MFITKRRIYNGHAGIIAAIEEDSLPINLKHIEQTCVSENMMLMNKENMEK